jgi:hypothetical protein
MPDRRMGLAAFAIALALAGGTARAQGDAPVDPYGDAHPPSDPADDIDDQVASALYQRGVVLLEEGEAAGAKTLFVESLERSPRGSVSEDALRMLREANRALGIADLDDGRPGRDGSVIDPYGGAPNRPLDPSGEGDRDRPGEDGPDGSRGGRRAVTVWGAAVGLVAGLAIAGPESDGDLIDPDGEPERVVSGGAFLVGALGAALGAGAAWWLTGKRPLSAGQSAAVVSGTNWGSLALGLFGDAATDIDSEPNEMWKFVAVGGVLGIGGGATYALVAEPSEGEVAFVNSLGLYGALGGFLAGVGMQPPHGEAYSINVLVGSTLGLTGGFLLKDYVSMTRRRTLLMDAGAAGGALVPWILIYPFLSDGETENDEQVAGWISVFTMGGGAALVYYLTREDRDEGESESAALPPPNALARRARDGRWRLGAPLPRPFSLPALAPADRTAIGLDLLSGRF